MYKYVHFIGAAWSLNRLKDCEVQSVIRLVFISGMFRLNFYLITPEQTVGFLVVE